MWAKPANYSATYVLIQNSQKYYHDLQSKCNTIFWIKYLQETWNVKSWRPVGLAKVTSDGHHSGDSSVQFTRPWSGNMRILNGKVYNNEQG